MAKFMVLFSYSTEATASLIKHPADRAEQVRKLMEAAGGTLEDFYWMLGDYDGMAVAELPDASMAAAVALAAVSTGSVKTFETHELIPHADIAKIEETATRLSKSYVPPEAMQ